MAAAAAGGGCGFGGGGAAAMGFGRAGKGRASGTPPSQGFLPLDSSQGAGAGAAAAAALSSQGTASGSQPSMLAEKIPFDDICLLFNRISDAAKSDDKKELLSEFFNACRRCAGPHESLFPVVRLLVPLFDKHRSIYGLKETQLAKAYIAALDMSPQSVDGKRMLNFRQPASGHAAGEFSSVCYLALRTRCPAHSTMSVARVNALLDELADVASKDKDVKNATRLRVFRELAHGLTAMQHKWLIRIILKDMKIGSSDTTILNVLHKGANQLYSVCCDLKKVCEDLYSRDVAFDCTGIVLFCPFKPMMGQRVDVEPAKIVKLLEHDFFTEVKHDGERIQIHKEGQNYQFYSRKANCYSELYGCDAQSGTVCPFIHPAFNKEVKDCILDGEMVIWDTRVQSVVSKSQNMAMKSVGAEPGDTNQHCFIAFDIVYYNGRSLCMEPLEERLRILESVFKVVPGRIMLSETKRGSSVEDFMAAANTALSNNEEGIMAKHAMGPYVPDGRNGKGWIKWKPEYRDSVNDLDLLIVAGYYGQGRRGGDVSHFLMAVAAPRGPGESPKKFFSFCKVGTGYKFSELNKLREQLRPKWIKGGGRSSKVEYGDLQEQPDVFIEPENSVILLVKAASVVESTKFAIKCTLREARCVQPRPDKMWYDCMSTDEMQQMRAKCRGGRLPAAPLRSDDVSSRRKRQREEAEALAPRTVRQVAAGLRGADLTHVKAKHTLLAGMRFCIINGTETTSKPELETKVVEFGGTITQAPDAETTYIVAGKKDVRVASFMSRKIWDVVQASWVEACVETGTLVSLSPKAIWFVTDETKAKLAELIDEYGDSYTEDVTAEDLRDIFAFMEHAELTLPSPAEIMEAEGSMPPASRELGLFRSLVFYLDVFVRIGDPSTALPHSLLYIAKHKLLFYGAEVLDVLSPRLTHIVVEQESADAHHLESLRHAAENVRAPLVDLEWIDACIKAQAIVEEGRFLVR